MDLCGRRDDAELVEDTGLPDTKGWINMNTQGLCQHTKDLHKFKPDKIPAVSRVSGHQVPLLTRKIFATDTC